MVLIVKQMDNCWRENKNHFVFGFLSWLVSRQLFAEVKVGFLMVGHTHHDNDQFFSGIGTTTKRKEARTWSDLIDLLTSTHKGLNVMVETLKEIADFSSFIGQHMNHIVNITKPHHFHFLRRDGVVQFRSRMFKDTQWSGWMAVFKTQETLVREPHLMTVPSVKVTL